MCADSTNVNTKKNLELLLQQHYNGIIHYEAKKNCIRPPYLVAYHHFGNHYNELRDSINVLNAVASKFPYIQFAIGEYVEKQLEIKEMPLIYMVNEEYRRKEYNTSQLDIQGLAEFCDEFLKSIDFKSEPLPTESDGLVKTAVALNFNELVLNNPKDVFVTFHKSWNYFQQNILPILERVACQLSSDGEPIEFVRIKVDANTLPHNWIRPYLAPLHFFVRAENKTNQIEYTGEMPFTTDQVIKFIAKNATKQLKRYNRSGQLLKQWKAKSHSTTMVKTTNAKKDFILRRKNLPHVDDIGAPYDEWDDDLYDEWDEEN